MILSTYSIGVNISEKQAFVVCLEKTFSRIRLKAHTLVTIDAGESVESLVEKIAFYLETLIEREGINTPQIYLGFPRGLSFVRTLEFPSSVKEDLISTIKYSLDKYLPLKVDDIGFDCRVVHEDRQTNKIHVVLGAGKKRDLKPFIDMAGAFDLGVSGIEIISTALVNYFFHTADLSGDRTFLFYADQSFLEVIVLHNGVFQSSHYVEIKDGELFDLIQNRIGDCSKTKTVVIMGGTGISAPLIKKVQAIPGILIREDKFNGYDLSSDDYIPALGLALNGVMKMPFQLNLLPVERRKKASRIALYSMYVLLFVSLSLGVVWGGSHMMHRRMLMSNANSELSRLQGEVFEIQEKKKEIARLEKKIMDLGSLTPDGAYVTDVLNELSRIIPSDAWLKGFYFVMGKDIRIDGVAEVASDLMYLIESSQLFKNAVFLSAITKDPDGKERFNIGFELK